MPTHRSFLLFLFSSLLISLARATPTAYEMLEKFGFPKGILPEGVQSYLLRPDGTFEVTLRSDCEFRLDRSGYLLKYKKKLTGRVAIGTLTELQGASVRILRFWFSIDEVVKRDSNLSFYVGPLSASYPVSYFNEIPQCLHGGGANLSDS